MECMTILAEALDTWGQVLGFWRRTLQCPIELCYVTDILAFTAFFVVAPGNKNTPPAVKKFTDSGDEIMNFV